MGKFYSLILVTDIFLQVYFRSIGFGVANRGVSLGFFPDISLAVLIVLYLLLVGWFVRVSRDGRLSVGLFCIVLGGLGNLVGRLLTGTVWDYIGLPMVPFRFNLSDLLISWGVISYILGVDGNSNFIRGHGHSGNK